MDERADGIKRVFWNPEEKRLRALFRVPAMVGLTLLAVQLVFAAVGVVTALVSLPSPVRDSLLLAGMTVAVLLLTWFLDRRHLRDIGLGGGGWWGDLVAGLIVGFGMVAVVVVVLRVAGFATFESVAVTNPDIPLGGGTMGVVYGLLFFGMVGLFEELLLRGYLLVNVAEGIRGTVDTDRTAVLVAVVSTSVLFGLLHAANPGGTAFSLVNITVAGLFFGLVFAVTGRLAFPIGAHITWNFGLGPVFGLPVSGLTTDTALLDVETSGPSIVTGGAFGPEGGIVMLVALAFGVGAFLLWTRRRDGPLAIDGRVSVPDLWVDDASDS